jgi:hypothetical protein
MMTMRQASRTAQSLPRLTLFGLGHNDELLKRLPVRKHLIPVALHRLAEPECYAEFRFFLHPLPMSSEYVGFVSCRWAEKFPKASPIEKLEELPLSPQCVYAPAPTAGIDWVEHSEKVHPGLSKLIPELAAAMGVELLPKAPTLWTSNFICHRTVWESYAKAFTAAAKFASQRWGAEPPFDVGRYDPSRKVAYLMERATMIYFASRGDLRVSKV